MQARSANRNSLIHIRAPDLCPPPPPPYSSSSSSSFVSFKSTPAAITCFFQEGACRGFYNRDTLISTLNIINTVAGTGGALPVQKGRARALSLVSLRDPDWLWGTGVPFEVRRSWMGKYTRQGGWRVEGGCEVSVNGEVGQGVRCSTIRGFVERYLNLNNGARIRICDINCKICRLKS